MAVEFLIRLYDGSAGRTAGDIISAKQVPHNGWGKEEGLPNYAIIRITDKDLPAVNTYNQRHYFEIRNTNEEWHARSRYRINLSTLPTNLRNSLFKNGRIEVSLSQIATQIGQSPLVFKRIAGT